MYTNVNVTKERILSQMNQLADGGTQFYLEGYLAKPENIIDIYMGKEQIYMPDLIVSEEGDIKQIWFDKLTDL